jgi:hypothetical protein
MQSPPRISEGPVAILQAPVTTAGASMLRPVPENSVRRTAACLEIDGG